MVDQLLGAIVGHCVGDFLLQNDWMAGNKKNPWPVGVRPEDPVAAVGWDRDYEKAGEGSLACAAHVCIYTFCVMLFSGWVLLPSPLAMLALAGLVALPHYLIDRGQFVKWWMKFYGQKNFAIPPMAPWSQIAVDNTFHFVCLYLTALFVAACRQ